jgi:hypothetical protein
MRWKRIALWILGLIFATSEITAAEGPAGSPLFRQWILGQTRFMLVGGRVVSSNGTWTFVIPKQVSKDGAVREQITFNGNGVTGALVYSYQRYSSETEQSGDPKVELVVDISSDGRFVLRSSDKDHPAKQFELTQVPGQPLSLSIPGAGKPRVLLAPTLWHMLIVHADDSRSQILPVLDTIRVGWHIGLTVQAAEDELVKMSAVSRKSDRKQWEEWVNQLGDPLWSRRNRADQSLRDVGPAVLGYLNRLNTNRLDAEQRTRIRHILRDLSAQTGEDTAEHVASMLIEDPLVWLALLGRPDESTRRAAAQQLAVLLNMPIAIDPKAEPDTQIKARNELREKIETIVGEGSKPDAKPANGRNKVSSGKQ